MLPEPNTRHIEEARALLISQYRGKLFIQGLLDSYIRPLQEVEELLWEVINSRILDDAEGVQLDTLGRLVKEIRRGRSNEEYRKGIRVKIKVLRSKGRIVDIIDVASISNAPGVPVVEEHRYLNFHVEAYGQTGERFLAEHLTKTRATSAYGYLVTSDLPEEDLLRFDDAADPGSVETFSDAYSGQGRLATAGYGLPSPRTGGALVGDPLALPAPRIDWFEPASGAEDDIVVLHGAFFSGATSVDIITFFPSATTPASFVIVNDARIAVTLPAHANGNVGIRVTTPGGVHTKSGFTYVEGGVSMLTEDGETLTTEDGETLTTE